jgi:hypothetical protein
MNNEPTPTPAVAGPVELLVGPWRPKGKTMEQDEMFYVAADPGQPGAAWAACVDKPEFAKSTAKDLADWVKRGAQIKRVDRDTMLTMMNKWVRPEKATKRKAPAQSGLFGA